MKTRIGHLQLNAASYAPSTLGRPLGGAMGGTEAGSSGSLTTKSFHEGTGGTHAFAATPCWTYPNRWCNRTSCPVHISRATYLRFAPKHRNIEAAHIIP